MTHKAEQSPNLQQWRSVIEDEADTLWRALDVYASPSAMAPITRTSHWPAVGKIAAALSALGLVLWLQWQSSQQIQALRTENLQLSLLSRDAMLQLDTLNRLQQLSPEVALSVAPQLLRVLSTADDPNVQLGALEALVQLQIIRSVADLPVLTSERNQARFIITTYQQLYGE